METPLLGLARLQMWECTKWPTARGSFYWPFQSVGEWASGEM